MMIKRGQMDGKTRFRFDQLRARPVDEQTLKKLDIEQTVPMETALSLLRDKDGTIKLNVPISGDIADPKFSVGDAVNQALLTVTTKASLTYLKYALGPYGIAIAQLPPDQLEALAKARSVAIKDYLVEQHGVRDDRILLCHPEIDQTSDAKPRAEILF